LANIAELSELTLRVERLLQDPSTSESQGFVAEAMRVLQMSPLQFSQALEVSPASVSRWINGLSVPQSRQLRAMQELLKLHVQKLSEPDGLEFHSRKIGVFSIDSFFHRAERAKAVYVLKNILGFQAGTNPAVREQLRNVFALNQELRIFYGFPRGSEASASFMSFKTEVVSEWPRNIFWKALGPDDQVTHLLGTSLANPFFLEHQDGRVDVFLEVPSAVLRGLDKLDSSPYMPLFVELSENHKTRLWSEWRTALENLDWDSAPVHIKYAKMYTDDILSVRERAYDFPSESLDEFDAKSSYIVADIEGKTVGTIRMTDSQVASPLRKWAVGPKYPLPHGKGVVEMTRGAVDPTKQRLGIYNWMMLRAVEEARSLGFKKATAAIEIGYPLAEYLKDLGFEDIGGPMKYNDSPRTETVCQSVVCDLEKSHSSWPEVEKRLQRQAAAKHVLIESIATAESARGHL
jgi:GNAT superfamily N-acetyltransferase